MVPGAGLEPARCYQRKILSLVCLPIPPPGHRVTTVLGWYPSILWHLFEPRGHFRLLPLVTLALLRIAYHTALGLLPFANKKPLARATKVADSASDLREQKAFSSGGRGRRSR